MFLGCSTITKSHQLWIFSNMLGFLTGCRFESVSTVNILIFYTTFSVVFSNHLITQDPTDITRTEGSSGFLSCYTNILSSQYSIKWLQDRQVISDGDEGVDKYSNRFTAYSNVFGNQQQNSLKIDNIQREDGSHLYSCALYYYNGTQIERSNTAEIKVLEIPNSRYPECIPIIGQMTNQSPSTITCRSEQTNPLPSLCLVRNGDEKISCETKNENNYIVIEHTFTPTIADETFMCVLETPAKNEYRHNCSFGPFNIMHKPDMTITGEELVIEGKEVIFICHGKGNPSQVKYEWKFIPQLPEGSYKFESLNSILRLTPTYEMRSTKLVCVGSNSIGESSTYLILNITSRQDKDEIHGLPASAKPSTGKDSKNLMATVLSVAGTSLLVISVLAASTICYIYLCFRKNFHPLGYKIAQPDVYSEPRDSLPPPVLSTDRVARWQKRNVGIQVSLDYNVSEEPLYSETPTTKVVTETETTPEAVPQNKSATYV